MVSRKRSLLLALVIVFASCASEPTQVVLVVDTNLRGPGGIDRVRVEVTNPGGTTQSAIAIVGPGQPDWPRTLGLARRDGALGPYDVRVIGETAGVSRVERRARFFFQEGRSLTVRIDLLSSCVGTTCPADQTCAASGCRPIDLSPTELLPFDGMITGLDAATPSDAAPDSGRDAGGDGGSIACTSDRECDSLDGPCANGACMMPAGVCAAMPVADDTACDDGMFCTDGDRCTAGRCGGTARDCSAGSGPCAMARCDEAADMCVRTPLGDGTPCDDGLFCSGPDTCSGGMCRGPARSCADASDCTADSCDEAADACVNDGAPREGMGCDDGMFCTTGERCGAGACGGGAARDCGDALFCNGTEVCDEAADSCAMGAPACPADMYTCTVETCAEPTMGCSTTREETGCAGPTICNPVAYPAPGSGCGPAPSALTVSCPASGPTGTAVACTARLAAGVGIPGEASRLSCLARPRPATLFNDDFSGGLDPAWTTVVGTPRTSMIGGDEAATASTMGWEAQVTVPTTGLTATCVDFEVAQANAGGGERIRWDFALGAAGAFTTVFDLDFATWENGAVTYGFNRNVCAAVTGGATTARWRLRMSSNAPAISVDDVVITGVSAPVTTAISDDMASASGWMFAGGTAPYVAVQGGSSAMFAEGESYTATRAALDASACDVIDVDFLFGYSPGAGALDMGDDLRLEVSVGGGAFATVEFVDLNDGSWNQNGAFLPWLGLRRVSDLVPAAAGSSSVVFRFTMRADNPPERTWVDDFAVRCVDLRTPSIGAIGEAGGGDYTFEVTSPVPIDTEITCTWSTINDGPLMGLDTFTFAPL